MDPVVRLRESRPPALQDFEVVERKGLGHPDTMCDGIAEHICVRLCRYSLSVTEIVLSELERLGDLRDALLEERVQVY